MADNNTQLDVALCNAICAVQDHYTFDSFEQASLIRGLAKIDNVIELTDALESCGIKGYDLTQPLIAHKNRYLVAA